MHRVEIGAGCSGSTDWRSLAALSLVGWIGQAWSGWHEFRAEQLQHGEQAAAFANTLLLAGGLK